MSPQRVAIAASNHLVFGDGAHVQSPSGKAESVVNTGNGTTYFGVGSKVGNTWSTGYVDMRRDSLIDGALVASNGVHYESGAHATGGATATTPLGPLQNNGWAASLPTNQSGSLAVGVGETRNIQPGAFGEASLKRGALVKMAPGTYRFSKFTLEPGSRIELTSTADPTIIYVDGDAVLRGLIVDGASPNNTRLPLLVVSLSSNQLPIEAPFNGTVHAPNGKVFLLPGTYEGSFFGRDIELSPGTVVVHRSFPFSLVLPQKDVSWAASPVNLTASVAPGGVKQPEEFTQATPVSFAIPDFLRVYQGNAGTGAATLKFRETSGTVVTCTYEGNAPIAHPIAEIDLLLGLRYRLVGCDNQRASEEVTNATWFQLSVESGDQQAMQPETIVQVHLGGGCSDVLDPEIAPAEVAAMRQQFNWKTAKPLPETDPDGHPALWHGLIYIEKPEQLRALERWRIYYDTRPITASYNESYRGKCGRVEHSTDGKGVLVYAIFPAKFFNAMRNIAIEAQAKNVAPPFQMITPSTPNEPEHVNSDGSIRYSSLGASGYGAWLAKQALQHPGWLGKAWRWSKKAAVDTFNWTVDHVVTPGANYIETGYDYANYSWDEFVDWEASALDRAWEGVQIGLQEFVLIFDESVDMRADFRVVNMDKMFARGTLMTQMWGPGKTGQFPASSDNRPYIYPTHASFRVRQWGWGILPVMDESEINVDGHAKLEMIRKESSGGSSADFCIKLDTSYAMMTTDLIPNEVCHFNNDGQVHNFIEDSNELIRLEQHDLMAFTQLRDSSTYAKDVIGAEHPRIDVLIGWTANQLTGFNDGRAFCPCLDFPGTGANALRDAADFTAYLNIVSSMFSQVSTSILSKDLWWPDSRTATSRSRGVMTHEYGHFNMCALINEQAPNGLLDAPAMFRGLLPRLWDGETKTSEQSIMLETIADTFAMQVVGASNYVLTFDGVQPLPGAQYGQPGMGYCTKDPSTPTHCLDVNYAGINDCYRISQWPDAESRDFHDEVCRMESLVYDAFDSSTIDTRTSKAATKGDLWNWDGQKLTYAPQGFIASDDEPVQLPASAWSQWVENWLKRGRVPNKANVLGALVDTMKGSGANWCDRCEVLAIHHTATPKPARMPDSTGARTMDFRSARWQACIDNAELRALLPDPPDAQGNIGSTCKACPPRSAMVGGAPCVPCGADEIARGNACEKCPTGKVPNASNECVDCSGNTISVGGQCVDCPAATTANTNHTSCSPCTIDAVVDWSAQSCDAVFQERTVAVTAPNDNCPEDLWVEVQGVPQLVAKGFTELCLSIEPEGMLGVTHATCPANSGQVEVWANTSTPAGSALTSLASREVSGVWRSPAECPPMGMCTSDWCDSKATVTVDLTVSTVTPTLLMHAKARRGSVTNGQFLAESHSSHPACSTTEQ